MYLQYKTEKDGVVETRIERKMMITSEAPEELDHDAVNIKLKHITYSPKTSVYHLKSYLQGLGFLI